MDIRAGSKGSEAVGCSGGWRHMAIFCKRVLIDLKITGRDCWTPRSHSYLTVSISICPNGVKMRSTILNWCFNVQIVVSSLNFGFSNMIHTRIKISSLSIENNSEGSEICSDSETTNHSQMLSTPKCIRVQFKAWNFHYTIQTDLFGEEWVSTDEKKLCLPSTYKLVWVIIGLRLSPPSLYSAISLWSWSLHQV